MPLTQPQQDPYYGQYGGYGQPVPQQQQQSTAPGRDMQGAGSGYEPGWDQTAQQEWDKWHSGTHSTGVPGHDQPGSTGESEGDLRNRLTRESQYRGYTGLAGKIPTYQAPNDAATMQQYGVGLERLNQQSQQGLMPEDLAAFWKSRAQVGDMASQQRGALQQQAQMQGGGVATGGNMIAMQDQANQMGDNRLAGMDMNQAGIASQRRQQALMMYLQGLSGQQGMEFRNAQALNQFNQQNFGNNFNLQQAYQQHQGAVDAANSQGGPLNTILNVAGAVGAPVSMLANQKNNGAATQGVATQGGAQAAVPAGLTEEEMAALAL